MKRLIFAATMLAPCLAFAQQGTNVLPGQVNNGGPVNQPFYLSNTDPVGFAETAEAGNNNPVTGVGTTQAAGTVLAARTVIVSCSTGNTALVLPSVQKYVPIVVINRGSVACLVFPPSGAYLETAAGTLGAVNASYSLAAGTDVIFRPAIINSQTEFLQ